MDRMPISELGLIAFRGLRNVILENCGTINILVGGNNSGKTSALEALLLLSNPRDISQWMAPFALRGSWPLVDLRYHSGGVGRLDSLNWLFPHSADFEPKPIHITGGSGKRLIANMSNIMGETPRKPISSPSEYIEGVMVSSKHKDGRGVPPEPGTLIEIQTEWHGQQLNLLNQDKFSFRLILWEHGGGYRLAKSAYPSLFPIAFATPISHRSDGYQASRIGHLIRGRRKDQVINLLRHLDPNINDIVMVTQDESNNVESSPSPSMGASLHIDHAITGLVPIHAMGDGIRRALHLATILTDVGQGGVILIDEIDVGMHISVLKNLIKWLGQACLETGSQLFATTHSLEAVDAILQSIPLNHLVLYRIGKEKAHRLSGHMLHTARVELGHEVR